MVFYEHRKAKATMQDEEIMDLVQSKQRSVYSIALLHYKIKTICFFSDI